MKRGIGETEINQTNATLQKYVIASEQSERGNLILTIDAYGVSGI